MCALLSLFSFFFQRVDVQVKCDFRNEHTHPVKLFWISGTQAKQSHTWTIEVTYAWPNRLTSREALCPAFLLDLHFVAFQPGENLRMSAFISHLFIARDTRVQVRIMVQSCGQSRPILSQMLKCALLN